MPEEKQTPYLILLGSCQITGQRMNLGCGSFIFRSSWPHTRSVRHRVPPATCSCLPACHRCATRRRDTFSSSLSASLALFFPCFFFVSMFSFFPPHYCFTSLPCFVTCLSVVSLPSAVPLVPSSSPVIPWLTLSSLSPPYFLFLVTD